MTGKFFQVVSDIFIVIEDRRFSFEISGEVALCFPCRVDEMPCAKVFLYLHFLLLPDVFMGLSLRGLQMWAGLVKWTQYKVILPICQILYEFVELQIEQRECVSAVCLLYNLLYKTHGVDRAM